MGRNKTVGLAVLAVACLLAWPSTLVEAHDGSKTKFRGLLGPDSNKVRHADGKTYLWAGRGPVKKDGAWYDFTDSVIPTSELQFGIGKDSIPSIDDPLFVSTDDPRLLDIPVSPYRRDEKAKSADDIMVIGYVVGDDARAYPTALLDRHELVNDKIGGKPVTVGW